MKLTRTNDVPWVQAMNKGKYGGQRKPLAGEKLNASLQELPPGKKSFPLHFHYVTEEAMFVISGTAKVRTLEGETRIGPGDHVSFSAGGPAHQLINDGSAPLVYLAMSAGQGVDIVEYPDTGKIASAVGASPNGKRFMFRKDSQVDYLDGDKDG